MGNSVSASEDAQRYLDGYPNQIDNPKCNLNVRFYSNEISSRPDGGTIDFIHQNWKGRYALLERHHGYIQWLFPIREEGLNHLAQRLHAHEATTITNDPVLQGRIITSYELMLDFYGMKLVDRKTGQIARADKFREQFDNLNDSFHNNLRITRILKCLGEVGLEHMKKPFVMFVLHEIIDNKELSACFESCQKYWSAVIRDDTDRAEIQKYANDNADKVPRRRFYRSWRDDDDDEKKKKSHSNNRNQSSSSSSTTTAKRTVLIRDAEAEGEAKESTERRSDTKSEQKEEEEEGDSPTKQD